MNATNYPKRDYQNIEAAVLRCSIKKLFWPSLQLY